MSWLHDFMPLSTWALQNEDLRHRYIYARSAAALPKTPGLGRALEVTAVLAIYQAALGKGYQPSSSIDYERAYPHSQGNPKRADLAFKDSGRGKNWAYVEVKQYGQFGKSQVAADIQKLLTIQNRAQRWIFVYRIRRTDRRMQNLQELLELNFGNQILVHEQHSFPSVPVGRRKEGLCDLCLARVQ